MEITAQTKVGTLLDTHPELEAALIAQVPAFVKLRNPILRATVAKVATLEQAARIGGIELPVLINALRRELGQAPAEAEEGLGSRALQAWPPWFSTGAVVAEWDVNQILAEGGHPLARAKQALSIHPAGAIVVLRSDFEPAPLLALAKQEGLMVTCIRQGTGYQTGIRRA